MVKTNKRYKIDWMAFTISFEEHDGDKRYFDEHSR